MKITREIVFVVGVLVTCVHFHALLVSEIAAKYNFHVHVL